MKSDVIQVLSAQELAAIDAELAHVPCKSAAAIDALKIVQHHRGWVSDASLEAVAHHLEMSSSELDGIATFYSLIFRRPVGNKVILLCTSVCCWIKGCEKIQQKISDQLHIGLGETTADRQYTLIPASCLGDCDHAPVLMVNQHLHRDVTDSSIEQLLDED
jgi:NADH-quinone oxidoreductase subunit E